VPISYVGMLATPDAFWFDGRLATYACKGSDQPATPALKRAQVTAL